MKKGMRKPLRRARNPQRTQECILAAALTDFSAKGLAGARVDEIARRAGVNKRMLYHYFGSKDGLFSAVLGKKLTEREALLEDTTAHPADMFVRWFKAGCNDPDWYRLLQWEALQPSENHVVHEERRRAVLARALQHVRQLQAQGTLPKELVPEQLLISMIALTAYPLAFPQQIRLITGRSVFDPEFQKQRCVFLEGFARLLAGSEKRVGLSSVSS
jgi:TetR/AcrR family transcriptional regulator